MLRPAVTPRTSSACDCCAVYKNDLLAAQSVRLPGACWYCMVCRPTPMGPRRASGGGDCLFCATNPKLQPAETGKPFLVVLDTCNLTWPTDGGDSLVCATAANGDRGAVGTAAPGWHSVVVFGAGDAALPSAGGYIVSFASYSAGLQAQGAGRHSLGIRASAFRRPAAAAGDRSVCPTDQRFRPAGACKHGVGVFHSSLCRWASTGVDSLCCPSTAGIV